MNKWLFMGLLLFSSCQEKEIKDKSTLPSNRYASSNLSVDDRLKIDAYWQKANSVGRYSQERQAYLDSALAIKPDSAFFWQQKAMPLYKERKFSLGKPFLAKAVEFDREGYLDYSAFLKCLFSNEYEEAIAQFLEAKALLGDRYVMDHTYNFYLGLCYLQLNKFDKAKAFLVLSKEQQIRDFPNEPQHEACHYLDWFYLGVADYELGNWAAAVTHFDMALKTYPTFADAHYYKAICMYKTGARSEAEKVYELAMANKHNTINEDQVYYVIYPYQVFHKLSPLAQ